MRLSCLALTLALLVPASHAMPPAAPPQGERIVYLARDLPDENLIVLGATLAAWRRDSVLLLDSPKATPYLKSFLTTYKPARVIPIGGDANGIADLERRLAIKVSTPLQWTNRQPVTLWRSLFNRAEEVVVCPAHPRGALLQAACLAAVSRAPLFVLHGRDSETARLVRKLGEWHTRRVHLVGKAEKLAEKLPGIEHVILSGESAVAVVYQKQLARQGHIENVVFANPADTKGEMGGTSALAPWIASRRRAALLLTNTEGSNVAEVMERAQRREAMRHVDALLFLANLKAIPVWRRPNPIPGDKDPQIEMEPLTPSGKQPFSFAVGRLFHEDRAVVPLMLARQRMLLDSRRPLKALVASNSGGGLSLLETLSRNTIAALRHANVETTTLIGRQVNRDEVRKQMPRHNLFLWEGHSGTLMNDYEFPTWDDAVPPTFVFLQSCLSLTEPRVGALLNRGAFGVLGSSTRTYSGSGGACSLAFFNAVLYEDRPIGDALRQAKNFLLAYSLLKEKRLGNSAKRGGANIRSAWAFTLWGDPTLKLPLPPRSGFEESRVPFVRHEVHGNRIVISLPEKAHAPVRTDKYRAELLPNERAAGLVKKAKIDDRRPVVPFVFVEVHLPRARAGLTPCLSSRLPSKRWIFCWDARRRRGYLLVVPRPKDTEEMRFHVRWETVEAKNTLSPITGSGK
ncbi:MAG: C25 family cysteine peptidase [Gemmataceae bacterium]